MTNESFTLQEAFISGGIMNFTPRIAFEWCKKGAVLVDVRESYMNRFKQFDVPELIFCPFSILEENYMQFPHDKPLIFADAVSLYSKEAVKFLAGKIPGSNIVNLAGGLVEWERDGLPVLMDKSERLTGSCMCQLRTREK